MFFFPSDNNNQIQVKSQSPSTSSSSNSSDSEDDSKVDLSQYAPSRLRPVSFKVDNSPEVVENLVQTLGLIGVSRGHRKRSTTFGGSRNSLQDVERLSNTRHNSLV